MNADLGQGGRRVLSLSLSLDLISATGMSISESGKLDDGLLETNAVPGENEDGVSP